MSDTELMHMSEPASARRIEIFTGAGRRRAWPESAKAAIVAKSEIAGASVCAVARRHGLTPQQLFTWRRQARRSVGAETAPTGFGFVPVVSETRVPSTALPKKKRKRRGLEPIATSAPRSAEGAVSVEIEIGGAVIRIRQGADGRTVAAVLEAMKIAR
jgi:transposase